MGFLNNRTVNNIMTWDEIEILVSELQKCNQNTPKQKIRDLLNSIFIAKGCKKVYFENGFFIKELTVPVKSHEIQLVSMLVGNSLTHETYPLWFRDGYAFEPSEKVIQFIEKRRNCE